MINRLIERYKKVSAYLINADLIRVSVTLNNELDSLTQGIL